MKGFRQLVLNLFTPIVDVHHPRCQIMSTPYTNPYLALTTPAPPSSIVIAPPVSNLYHCQKNARYQVIFLWVVTTAMLLMAGLFHNLFPLVQLAFIHDPRYQYPYQKETINSIVCFFLGAGIPLILLALPYLLDTTRSQSQHNLLTNVTISPVSSSTTLSNSSTLPLTTTRGESIHTTTRSVSRDYPLSTPSLLQQSLKDPQSQTHPPNSKLPIAVQIPPTTTRFQGILSASVLGCYVALGVGTFLTTLFKTIVGRPRPNAISLSQHIYAKHGMTDRLSALNSLLDTITSISSSISTSTYPSIQNHGYLTSLHNSMSDLLANDALRSFPSGHSCFAFAGMIYLSLVLYTRYIKTITYARRQHIPLSLSPRAVFNVILYPPDHDRVKCLHCCYIPASTSEYTSNNSSSILDSSSNPQYILNNLDINQPTSPQSSSTQFNFSKSQIIPTHRTITGALLQETYNTSHDPIEVPPLALALIFYIIFPIVIAGFIAISRIMDFWHHPDDILAGSILGTCVAFLSFRLING